MEDRFKTSIVRYRAKEDNEMEQKRVIALDTLRTHYTTVDKVYDVIDEDDECYKINDNRNKPNWIPKRYMKVCEE